MQYSVQIPWQPGGANAPIAVPARPAWGGDQPPPPVPVSTVPSSFQPSSYLVPPSASLGGYHDALKTAQQRQAEAYVTYTPGPSVPSVNNGGGSGPGPSQRRGIPSPEVGMRYEGGATGSEHVHGTAFTMAEATNHLRTFQLWNSCYGWARTLGYFLAVVVLLVLAVVVDVLPLDAAADAIDPSHGTHGSAVHKLERQLSKQQKHLDGAIRDKANSDRKLHKKLRKKAVKQAKNFAKRQPNTHMSKLARGKAVVSEFMRDPAEAAVEDTDAVLEAGAYSLFTRLAYSIRSRLKAYTVNEANTCPCPF